MVRLPHDRLPAAAVERHGVLRNYFCDKDAEAVLGPDGWGLSLAWPSGTERHIDPAIDAGLEWWGGGLRRADMAMARRREGRVLTAFYDSWTLHGWSEWLRRSGHSPGEALIILHVDDHRDIDPPRIFQTEAGWTDPLTSALVTLEDPDSVERAIESGAIGMGSFMTPFLHRYSLAEVRHLCQPPKSIGTADYRVRTHVVADTLLDPEAFRPAIRLKEGNGIGPGAYRITPDLNEWLADLQPGPILLHLDLDYFNNRYDGDSDWSEREFRLDPPIEAVLDRVSAVTSALSAARLGSRIEEIAIAFSPGFFPAEFWEPVHERLLAELGRL